MSGNIAIHVIANGELARQALNAVVIALGTSTFATAIKISVLFAIIGTAVNYIRGKDLVVLAKWFIIYFALSTIMLGPKVTVQIIDSSNPGRADLTVANVPYGLGYPASIITSIAYGIVSVLEEAFAMPDDLEYNKTGMLFGSKLFRLSSEFHIINPMVKGELNEYIKNCVLGDILISKKYTMADLTGSKNLATAITEKTSNIRGIYIGGVFKTCVAAGVDLKANITKDINENAFKIFGKRIFGNVADPVQKLQDALVSTYKYFDYGNLSNSALEIMTQNLLINGIREGISTYTAETGATAAILNISTTQAMERMRMSLATSRNIATYTIPIIHTVLLLLMLSLFPIVILLAFQPSFTVQVLKNYFYTLIWIESWPLMFACLNMTVTFYAKEIGPAGLTLDNIDQLVLEHSDIANMAGYLMMAIPFISGGLVMGMASAFNTAASYIGGVLQSSASSAASEAASGNISVGNSSWANVNANKFDTNSTLMQGMSTEQLKTGVLRTTTPDGETVYDSSHAFSKLPINVKASDVLSESFSNQAEKASMAAGQDQRIYDQVVSDATYHAENLGKAQDSRQSQGESFSSSQTASAMSASNNMVGMAQDIAKHHNKDYRKVYEGLVRVSDSVSLSGDVGAATPAKGLFAGAGAKLAGSMSKDATITSTEAASYNIGEGITVSNKEMKEFTDNKNIVQAYDTRKYGETSQAESVSHLSQLGSDLRKASSASQSYSMNRSDSERLASAASYTRQHSGQIDSDLNQEIVNYVVAKEGREKAEAWIAGRGGAEGRVSFENDAKEYINHAGISGKILAAYQQNSAGINPDQTYRSGQVSFEAKEKEIEAGHTTKVQNIAAQAKEQGTGFDQQRFDDTRKKAYEGYVDTQSAVADAQGKQQKSNNDAQINLNKNDKEWYEKASRPAERSLSNFVDDVKPSFVGAEIKEKNKKDK